MKRKLQIITHFQEMKYIKNFESMHNNWQLLKNPDISISISIYLYIYILFF